MILVGMERGAEEECCAVVCCMIRRYESTWELPVNEFVGPLREVIACFFIN